MVAIGVATVWLVRGLIAITHNQFQCAETKRTMKRAWDRHLSRDLGIPSGASVRFGKQKPPDYATVRGLQVMRVCRVFARPDWGTGAGGMVRLAYAARDMWKGAEKATP
jgi:hypothetical protein